ncbi:DUF1289 domain-containing protein [Algiphilus aromaticivorans]|uniref:DUF1289 domain-containing protein n=1 Tax=Algiphilus aromaticivorans TaxID=382454 RepID=UPI000A054CE6|nr:DUF1289 domain-containing protein [Algiphilus aromaticivorans]
MSRQSTASTPVSSPCTGVCTLDAAGQLCVGCLRSGTEIAEWPHADEGRRREILASVRARRGHAPLAANQTEQGDE